MDTLVNDFYVIENNHIKIDCQNNYFNNSEYLFYEVIRTVSGVLIFLNDHLERLKVSLEQKDLLEYYSENEVKKCLTTLLQFNNQKEGNIKLLCKAIDKSLKFAAYYIPHSYPSKNLYSQGVKLKSYIIERNQPNLKQIEVNELIKTKIDDILNIKEFYEVLLINKNGNVTEGSKSNFFLIHEKTLYSAPKNQILKGITRKYVIEIANRIGLNYIEKDLPFININNFDSAFITGTSPKVLPVKEIDEMSFNTENLYLKILMEKYNEIFINYIKNSLSDN